MAVAGVVLQDFCALGTALAIYRIGLGLFRRDVAVALAMLSVFFPFFHANGGADYHNTIAAPLFFLSAAIMFGAIPIAWRVLR